ncbi:hypothetical protein FEM48_ZijujUnG0006500 [Ziziphus jujuba var. spinosa]|uniref:Uncharacterized protein n=1 Tax=Ziziphus jujuba var. spinosa TaxID=714518 RepID=A0A978UA18_ZIZJJ|nr:hypothetical protein FEM48_ZijujUnG0006500 [Ziziphus jujuba var. spinosa]
METTKSKRQDSVFLTKLEVTAHNVMPIGLVPVDLKLTYLKYHRAISHIPKESSVVIRSAGKIVDYATETVVRKVGYVINSITYFDIEDRVQQSIDEALRKGQKMEADVQKWEGRVDEIIVEANEFLKLEDIIGDDVKDLDTIDTAIE